MACDQVVDEFFGEAGIGEVSCESMNNRAWMCECKLLSAFMDAITMSGEEDLIPCLGKEVGSSESDALWGTSASDED